jgi:hypothetical protein
MNDTKLSGEFIFQYVNVNSRIHNGLVRVDGKVTGRLSGETSFGPVIVKGRNVGKIKVTVSFDAANCKVYEVHMDLKKRTVGGEWFPTGQCEAFSINLAKVQASSGGGGIFDFIRNFQLPGIQDMRIRQEGIYM